MITSPTPTPAGDFIVTSTLTINQLSAFDAGDVKCVVMADDVSLPTGVDLQTDSASSVLAILGRSHDIMASHLGTSYKLKLE